MQMLRYNPWGVGRLHSDFDRLLNGLGRHGDQSDSADKAATADWVPNVDIQEFDKGFQLFVDLPGVDPAAVDITLDGDVLTINGKREFSPLPNDEQAINRRTERAQGTFYRRFILPETVDAEGVQAKGENGVLSISIPKLAKAQPRRISVAA